MSRPAGSAARSSAASTTIRASVRFRRDRAAFHIACCGGRTLGSEMIPVPRSIARIPILRGLYRVALNGYARLSRGRYLVEERMGLRLLLDLDNAVDQQIFISGTWEKGTIDTLLGLARQERQRHGGETGFPDIGAHWGLYALLARQSGMFDRILAFEPDPTNYGQLQANLFLNDATTAIAALQLGT